MAVSSDVGCQCTHSEVRRTVIVDGCGAGPALPHEHDEHQQEAVAHALHARLAKRTLDKRAKRRAGATCDRTLAFDLVLDLRHILGNVNVIGRDRSIVTQHIVSLLLAAMFQQPGWRLAKEWNAQRQEACRYELHAHGNPPGCRRTGFDVVDDAVVDPEADDCADLVGTLEEACQSATDGRRRDLGDVNGTDGCNSANPKSSKKSSGIHQSELVGGDGAQDGTDCEDSVGYDDCPSSTELFE